MPLAGPRHAARKRAVQSGAADDLTLYGTTHGDSSPKTGWVKYNRKYPYPCSEAEKHGIHGLPDARRKKILVLLAPPRGLKTAQAEVHLISEVRLATADELKEMGYPSPGSPTYWLFFWKS